MQERPRGNEFRTTVICIDSYNDCVPVGRFYNPNYTEGKAFTSLRHLLVQMEDMLDSMRFPQSFTAARAFGSFVEPGKVRPSGKENQEGKLATFSVRILFRQNASWQGSVAWLEGKQEESFRSVLELILLMDSALQSGK